MFIVVIYFAYKNIVLTFAGKLFLVHVIALNKLTFISWRSCTSMKKHTRRTGFNPYCSFTLFLSKLIFPRCLKCFVLLIR